MNQNCSLCLERLGLETFFRMSRSRLNTVTPMSWSCIGLHTPTSRSRLCFETLTSPYHLDLDIIPLIYIILQMKLYNDGSNVSTERLEALF